MECQSLLSRKNEKSIINLSSAELAHSMVSVNSTLLHGKIRNFKKTKCNGWTKGHTD